MIWLGLLTLPRALRAIPFTPRTGDERPVPVRLVEGAAGPLELGEREKLLMLYPCIPSIFNSNKARWLGRCWCLIPNAKVIGKDFKGLI